MAVTQSTTTSTRSSSSPSPSSSPSMTTAATTTKTTTSPQQSPSIISSSFRSKKKRTSNIRAIVFGIESFIVLSVYLVAIWYWNTSSSSSDDDDQTASLSSSSPSSSSLQQEPKTVTAATDNILTSTMTNININIDLSREQQILLSLYGVVYFTRLNVMSSWLLPRQLSIEELTFVILIWIPSILSSFVVLAVNPDRNESQYDKTLWKILVMSLSACLYVVGSFTNTYSELQRTWWKASGTEKNNNNKGRCYTGGLFSLSRNINYFGDTLLFSGWALMTFSITNSLWVPIVMGSSFWFYHIPDKEVYLSQRYDRDWETYVQKTPYAFIPYVC